MTKLVIDHTPEMALGIRLSFHYRTGLSRYAASRLIMDFMALESEHEPSRQLIAILRRGYESKDLDYKGPISWDENAKKACCGLVKDILGMANTAGRFIIVGVSEGPAGFSWDGLSPEQLGTFETSRVNRFLQTYADPPINTLLRKIEHENKNFVIIEIPLFPDTPHICVKEYPEVLTAPTLYVRTDNNETAPIRSSADFRTVLERAVRNRSDTLLTSIRSILRTGAGPEAGSISVSIDRFRKQRVQAVARFEQINPLKDTECAGYFEASFFPEHFEQSRFTLEQLRSAASRGSVDLRGWPFLYIHPNTPDRTYAIEDGFETFVQTKDFGNDDLVDFWRLQQSGFFYQRTAMRPASIRRQDGAIIRCVVDLRAASLYIAEAIHCLTRLYEGLLDDADEVSLMLALLGTENRVLVSSGPFSMPLFHSYTCRIPEITVERRRSLADWRAGTVDHAVEIANEVYQRFNWPSPNLDLARTAINKMFARTW